MPRLSSFEHQRNKMQGIINHQRIIEYISNNAFFITLQMTKGAMVKDGSYMLEVDS